MALLLKIGGFVVALYASIIAIGEWSERRRNRGFARYCLERGYKYSKLMVKEERPRRAAGALVDDTGDDPLWGPAISGSYKGVPFTAFECSWSYAGTGGLRLQRASNFIGAIFWRIERTLPQFLLTARGFWTGDSLMQWCFEGATTIDFDDSPEFTRHFRVQGKDVAAVRALFTRELRQALAIDPRRHVAGAGKELMWWRGPLLPPPEALDVFLMEGERVRSLFARE
jgi:hypothetical protein